jgi:multiple sugar transport system permease protein
MASQTGRFLRSVSPRAVRKRVEEMDQTNLYALVSMLPTFIFLIIITGSPIVYALYVSFTDITLFDFATPTFVGLDNYIGLLSDTVFYESIVRGAIFAGGSMSIQVTFGLLLAILLNKKFLGSSLARSLVVLTYMIPTVTAVLIWKWMLSQNSYGFVNHVLTSTGITENAISFFASESLAMISVIFVNGWKFTSFAVIIFLARLQSIDQSLYEQARISGASTFQQFKDITLPNLRSAILLVVLLRTIWTFNKFDIVYLFTRGGPREATTTVPVYIFNTGFFDYDLAGASAAAMVIFGLLAITAAIYFYKLKPSKEVTKSEQ